MRANRGSGPLPTALKSSNIAWVKRSDTQDYA